MHKWLLVERVETPGVLVSNPHVPFPRYVGKDRPEVIMCHVDLSKAIDKGCLVLLAGPVVAADAAAASVLLERAAPKTKPAAPAAKKDDNK